MHLFGVGLSLLAMLSIAGPQPSFTVLVFAVAGYLWCGHMPLTTEGYEPIVQKLEEAAKPPVPSPERQEALQLAWEEIEQIERQQLGDGGMVS